MARVAAIHGVGVLVIDEINRLSGSSSGGAASMLSFFVQLTNSLGIPVVLVGTYKPGSCSAESFIRFVEEPAKATSCGQNGRGKMD